MTQDSVQCPNCRAVFDANLNFCGRCGLRLADAALTGNSLSGAASKQTMRSQRRFLMAAVIFMLLLLVGGSIFALVSFNRHPSGIIPDPIASATSHPSSIAATLASTPGATPSLTEGRAWFYSHHAQNDSVALVLSHVSAPPAGKIYIGWLLNPKRPHQWLLLGSLQPDKQGKITFKSEKHSSFNTQRQNLSAVFTQMLVTLEDKADPLQQPSEQVVLRKAIDQ